MGSGGSETTTRVCRTNNLFCHFIEAARAASIRVDHPARCAMNACFKNIFRGFPLLMKK
jgi:hypothetical protein